MKKKDPGPRILLVEDSKLMHTVVELALNGLGQLTSAFSLKEARTLLEENFDLLLLDVELPDGNGFEFCQELRSLDRFQNLPLIFLTGASRVQERERGFGLGADDYIVKPFEPQEFLARIKSRLRKKSELSATSFCKSVFLIELGLQKAFLVREGKNHPLSLTPIEFKLLVYFLKNEDKLISRESLLKEIWGNDVHVSTHTLDTHISSLRKKIGEFGSFLKTIIKQGYLFSLNGTGGIGTASSQ